MSDSDLWGDDGERDAPITEAGRKKWNNRNKYPKV